MRVFRCALVHDSAIRATAGTKARAFEKLQGMMAVGSNALEAEDVRHEEIMAGELTPVALDAVRSEEDTERLTTAAPAMQLIIRRFLNVQEGSHPSEDLLQDARDMVHIGD